MALVNGPKQPKKAIDELVELLEKDEVMKRIEGTGISQSTINRKILEAIGELERKLPMGPI